MALSINPSENNILDFTLDRIQKKGWLSLASLYFDNAYWMNIYTSRGYTAYSPSLNLFFSYSALDSTASAIVDGTYAVMPHELFGMQQTITAVGGQHLQHLDIAQYSYYDWYNDAQTVTPCPKIPTKAEIMAYTLDEKTGLYTNADIAVMINGEEKSVVSLYDQTAGTAQETNPDTYRNSGALIERWQQFYKNQEKFIALINKQFDITDAM